jgi:phage shock protein A
MSTFQLLLGKLEREHSNKLQKKDLIIRELQSKLVQVSEANASLGEKNDALQLEIDILTSRPHKTRKTAMDSSSKSNDSLLSEILAGETPPVAVTITKEGV